MEAKFGLGNIVGTPGAIKAMEETGELPIKFLERHVSGDWGNLDDHDKKENDFSVDKHLRILSAYELKDGTRIWIITEADRSVTTILLPSEY